MEDQAKTEEEGDKRKEAVNRRWKGVSHQGNAEDWLDEVKAAGLTAVDLIGPERVKMTDIEDVTEEVERWRKGKSRREKQGEGEKEEADEEESQVKMKGKDEEEGK